MIGSNASAGPYADHLRHAPDSTRALAVLNDYALYKSTHSLTHDLIF